MSRIIPLIFLWIIPYLLQAQEVFKNEGITINNTITGDWTGINVPRSVRTTVYFLNNSITSVNSSGFLLQAGDEAPLSTNNNLDGAQIIGNKFTWNGTDQASITHGVFMGYNINYTVRYNYLDKTPYGILYKSGTDAGSNMTYSSGYGASYNIVKNAKLSVRMKGINGVQIYNNTFYSSLSSGTIILIDANHDRPVPAPSTGAKIKNNIFYTVNNVNNISIESGCLANFESDYNVFYCESGTPMFSVDGTSKTFAQWQAMGYDLHSVVKNPDFINTTGFVPRNRLDYGINLGTGWQTGLSTSAAWSAGSTPATTNQNGTWQAGAIIYPEAVVVQIPQPVFVSSAVENSTSSVVEMNYNLALAAIVPAASAFQVTVNSVSRNINSVAVSGTRVLLTLVSPVVYGDVVTVGYTKPSSSPLQTPAGGQAASVSGQTVINNVAYVAPPVITPPVVVNTPPVVVVNYTSDNLSGFVGELDATGSYDANNDNLSYTWVVPSNIPVSSTSSATVKFLSPVVGTPQTVEFTLKVSDGKTTQSKTIPVEILPYKPELEFAEIQNIEASSYQSPYYPYNILDGNIGTMWSANGDEQWLIMELKDLFNVQHVKIAFQPGQKKTSYFDILGSSDRETWEPILSKSASCGFSGDLHVFNFPESKASLEFRYIKLIGHSNSTDTWNYISEFKIFGYKYRNPGSYEEQPVKLYPNPANVLVNVRIDDTTLKPDFIRIVNLTGKVVYEDELDPEIRDFQIPLDIKKGIYIVQLGSGELTFFAQKLVVNI
jgi:hypothetical protein